MYSSFAQNPQSVSLNIGNNAPGLRVNEWLKGNPIQAFEKGKIYVLEFWATWCKPCIAAMPHVSALARQYRNKIEVLGIDVYEKNTPLEKIKSFMNNMGDLMDYSVAADKNKFMETYWVKASGNEGIPKTIIVNEDGKVAWIGHPKELEQVVPKILDYTWDIKQASTKWNFDKYLANLDDSLNYELMIYRGDDFKQDYIGKPDAALLAINEIIRKEPGLKYAPFIGYNTFSSLIKTNTQKAYEYGKVTMVTPTYEAPAFEAIIGAIDSYSDKLNLPAEIYELGAEAYQMRIDQTPYQEIVNMPQYYHLMAWWYWLAKNKPKAIAAEQTAVSTLKSREFYSQSALNLYMAQLDLYKVCAVDE
jgi:thiol-disulfide isomerase/thioredoxin